MGWRGLRWHATDVAVADATGDWFVTGRPDRATWQDDGDGADADAEKHGVTIEGDAGLVEHWIDNTAHIAD